MHIPIASFPHCPWFSMDAVSTFPVPKVNKIHLDWGRFYLVILSGVEADLRLLFSSLLHCHPENLHVGGPIQDEIANGVSGAKDLLLFHLHLLSASLSA
jgi:hypothetical protein